MQMGEAAPARSPARPPAGPPADRPACHPPGTASGHSLGFDVRQAEDVLHQPLVQPHEAIPHTLRHRAANKGGSEKRRKAVYSALTVPLK